MSKVDWAESVDNNVNNSANNNEGESKAAPKEDSLPVTSDNTIVYDVYTSPYIFKKIANIWSDDELKSKAFSSVDPELKLMMQDNEVVPFQFIKYSNRKYFVGEDYNLYEFISGILVPAMIKNTPVVWKSVLSMSDIKKSQYKKKIRP